MRQAHEVGARIGDGRHARFRYEAAVLAVEQRLQQRRERLRRRVHVQFGNADFLQRPRERMVDGDQFQEGARRLGVFGHEVLELAGDVLHLFRQDGRESMRRRVRRAEGIGDEIERTGHLVIVVLSYCRVVKNGMPARRSMPVRAISGRPVRAVGSLLSMRSSSAMPRPSFLALPAQSYGCSMRR